MSFLNFDPRILVPVLRSTPSHLSPNEIFAFSNSYPYPRDSIPRFKHLNSDPSVLEPALRWTTSYPLLNTIFSFNDSYPCPRNSISRSNRLGGKARKKKKYLSCRIRTRDCRSQHPVLSHLSYNSTSFNFVTILCISDLNISLIVQLSSQEDQLYNFSFVLAYPVKKIMHF